MAQYEGRIYSLSRNVETKVNENSCEITFEGGILAIGDLPEKGLRPFLKVEAEMTAEDARFLGKRLLAWAATKDKDWSSLSYFDLMAAGVQIRDIAESLGMSPPPQSGDAR